MASTVELQNLISVFARLGLMLPLCLAILLDSDKVLGQVNISQASQASPGEKFSAEQYQAERLVAQETYARATLPENGQAILTEEECSPSSNYVSCIQSRYQQHVTEYRQTTSASDVGLDKSESNVGVDNLRKKQQSISQSIIYKNHSKSLEAPQTNCTGCVGEHQQQQIFEHSYLASVRHTENPTQHALVSKEVSTTEPVEISEFIFLRKTQSTLEDPIYLNTKTTLLKKQDFKKGKVSLKRVSFSKVVTETEKIFLSTIGTSSEGRSESDTYCESTSIANERRECYLQLRQNAERSLAEARQSHNTPDEAQALLSLGNAYLGLEEYEKARQSFQEALERYGSNFPDGRANALIGIALSSRGLGSRSEAIARAEEALDITKKLQSASQPSRLLRLSTFFYSLNETGQEQENVERAIELSQQALQISRTLGNRHQEVISSLVLLGAIYSSLERYSDAIAVYEQLPSLYRLTENQVGQINALIILGDTYIATESYASARTAGSMSPFHRQ